MAAIKRRRRRDRRTGGEHRLRRSRRRGETLAAEIQTGVQHRSGPSSATAPRRQSGAVTRGGASSWHSLPLRGLWICRRLSLVATASSSYHVVQLGLGVQARSLPGQHARGSLGVYELVISGHRESPPVRRFRRRSDLRCLLVSAGESGPKLVMKGSPVRVRASAFCSYLQGVLSSQASSAAFTPS
jgi:hypothetical protein